MKRIKNLAVLFVVIFAIFSWMRKEADFVGVADVLDDTLVEVSGEDFTFGESDGSSLDENSDAKNGRIFIEKNFMDDNLLKISVYAEEVLLPVIGVSFHLKYEPAKISFVRHEAGDFLETGGKPFYLVKDSPEKNKIYFGATLKKGDAFPTQGGKIVDFYFKILDYATTEKSDTNAQIGQSGNNVAGKENSKILFSFSNGNVSTMDNGAEKMKNINFENSEIDLLEKDGLSQSIASVFRNFDFLKNKFFLGILLGIAIFGGLSLALFLAFKHGKKRAESSVNFK
ncbi:hypothetical protein COY05_01710 [Candidatus Peregrinibacteria bacterium CG_4_10_14_0_2_um_filter_38_24]|nr:MAG: hypothetical protein COY05_01710 [Candidatus Peregrinibacteria bacterium CG_4_10_14_0_2_um_filter_38_24]PJC39042.1 MAG: hypothetical protein CO044_01775 [Candidatus Peregrinibacteria bacterium CG_4_9_14_0_2_um_filter_38_9]